MSEAFKVCASGTILLVDRDGIVRYKLVGFSKLHEKALTQEIGKLVE